MALNKKRGYGREENPSCDESPKFRKKRSKVQLEHDNFRAMVSQLDRQIVGQAVVENFVKMLKSSLFMHQSRLFEIHYLLSEDNIENDRLKGVYRLLNILREPPAVHSFLSDMALLFLKPEEALDLQCFEAYRSRMQALDILLKLQQYQRTAKCKAMPKAPLKSLRDCDPSEILNSKPFYDQFCSWLSSDPHLRDIIAPLFPDQPFDASNVCTDDFETVTSEQLNNYETDGFEVVNWANAPATDLSSLRQCTCCCHHQNASGHCGLCAVKFVGEHVYVWRGSRLVRGQISFSDLPESDVPQLEEMPSTISPSKLASLGATDCENNSDWSCVFRAIDSMENDAGDRPLPKSSLSSSSATVCRKLWPNDDSTQDVLKQAFVETFGRNSWGRGYSPLKRAGPSLAMGGQNEESNSTSYVFVRGYDGANTMLGIVAADSNATAAGPSGQNFEAEDNSNLPPMGSTSATASPESSRITDKHTQRENDSWTEDEDRYLLEQFKLQGSVYEAGLATMAKLSKPLHAVRERLKFLLDLLKETT